MFSKSNVTSRNEPSNRNAQPLGSGQSGLSSSSQPSSLQGGKNGATPPSAYAGVTNPSANPSAAASAALKDTSAPAAASIQEQPREEVEGARLIVGPDVKLRGAEISDCDTLVVEGRVEATMDSRVIRIAEKGAFDGKVSIDIAEIHGTFHGELTARTQLTIHSTGKVKGKVRYGKLVIEEGGELCGEISALSSENADSRDRDGRARIEPVVLSAHG